MRQVDTLEEAIPLDDILTEALIRVRPPGSLIQNMSFNDKVGAMILLKVIKHLAGSNLPVSIQRGMVLMYATLGASIGMIPKKDMSAVDLMYRTN